MENFEYKLVMDLLESKKELDNLLDENKISKDYYFKMVSIIQNALIQIYNNLI